MGLSFNEFKTLKAENRIRWDTDSLNKGADEVRSYISSVSNQSQFKGNQWTDDEYNNNRAQAAGMRNRLRALEVYANSIKDKDEGAYRNAMSAHAQLSGALDQVDDWFRSNEGDAFKNNWENHRQTDKAQKITKGIDQMRAGSTAKEQAAALGLDEKELETAYKEQRNYEKQKDLVNRFGGMSYDELLGVINDPKRNAQRIVGEVDQYYKNLHNWENESEQDMELALKTAAERNNLSVEQVREIYNGGKEMHNRATYASDALSNDDSNYIFSRIIESGSAEQLQQLKKDLPSGKYYDKLRNSINLAIEEKKEQRYFLDVKEKFPEIDKLIETKENGDEFYRQGFNEEQDPEGFKEYDKANKLLSVYEKMGVDVDKYKQYKENYKNRLVNDMFQQVVSVAADKHPVLTSLASTPVNMIGSLGDVPKVIRAAFDDDYYYDPKGTASYTASNIRSTVSRKIDNPGWEFLYNSGMSMSDSAIGIAANYIPVVGQFVSSAMFFSSAGVSAANEVVENGGTPAQAAWTMLAHGGAELVFEKISLEKLNALQAAKNVKGAKQIITNILKQSFTESSEEVATTLANTLTDQMINGDLSAFARSKQAYIDEGLSEKEATAKAVTDWWASLGMDAAGGAFSGGVFGALGSTKAHLSYRSAMKNTTVTLGGVEMSAKDALKAAPDHFRELAQKLTENEGFDVKQLTEIAKDASEDGKARTLADSMERTIRESGKEKITAADVENLLNELYKENIDAFTTGEHIKSAAAWAKMDSLTGAEQKKTAVKEFNDSFDLAGKRRVESGKLKVESSSGESGDVAPAARGEVSSFGKAHPNGIAAFDKSGKEITVKGVDSVVNEYGKGDRTVSFVLGDGSVADADEVEFTDPDMQQLVELAKSYDTIGARALLSNYEDAKANGVSLETYKDAFAALYDVGQGGTDYEYAVKNPKYEATMQQIGAQAAQAAIEAGNYDADQSAKTQSFMSKRVRVKGKPLAQSKVSVERGIKDSKLSEEAIPLYQHLAGIFGEKKVIIADLGDSDYGMFVGNRILVNVNKEEHAIFVTLFHEGAHWAKVYDPEGFRALEKFIFNYLAATGVDVNVLYADILSKYPELKNNREALREEVVCKVVESLASNKEAFKVAAGLKENSGGLKKVGDFLKKLADRIMKHFKGDKELRGHNLQAQAFLDDHKALMEMAELCHKMYETARANEQTYGSRESGVRFSHAGNTADTADRSLLQQTQQFKRWFDNSKVVDKDGKPLVVYHQTDADFTVFNTESNGAGRYDDETPSGIFLKPSDNDIGLKGKKQMALYASIKNPLTVRNREELVRFYDENVDGYEEKKAALRYIDTEYSAKYEEASKRADEEYAAMHRKLRKKEITREEYDNFAKKEGEEERVIKEWEQAGNKASAELKALVTQFFKNSDYDGIIIEQDAGSFGRSTKTFIALDNTQVKSATDNIGTFDKSNPDIRYSKDDTIYDFKEAQNEIIQKSNPVNVDYLTWIRSAKDINTFEETLKSGEYDEGEDFDPSYTWNMAQKALKSGKITVYSSYPIQQGVFVTPSKMEAQDYAGGGKVYQKTVALTDVAWIDPTQGQYANVNEFNSDPNARHSKDDTIYDFDEDELWSDYEETHALDEIDPETGWTIGEVIESEVAAYNERRVTFNKLMEQNPDEAALIAMQATAKTIQRTLRSYNGVSLSGEDYERIARKVMRQYGIKEKDNKELVSRIAADIEEFVGNVKKHDKGSMSTFIGALATKCRQYLENSGEYEQNEIQQQVKDFILGLRGQTIIMDPRDEADILDDYDGSLKKLRKQFRGYVNIGLKEDEHKYKKPIYMDDILDTFAEMFGTGDSLGAINYLFPNGERPFNIEAWQWLADMIEFQKPKFVNQYLDGELESIESAALEMAYELATEAAATKGENAAKAKNLSRAQAAALIKERKTVKAEQKALFDAKKESYKRRLEEAEKKYVRAQDRYQKEHMRRELAEEDLSVLKAFVASDTKNFRQQYVEKQRKSVLLRQLGRKLNSMTKRLDGKANKNEYIPESLKEPILNVLRLFDVDPGVNKDGTPRNTPAFFGAFRELDSVSSRIHALHTAYSKLKGKTDFGKDALGFDINALAFDEGVLNELENLAELVEGRRVFELDSGDLNTILEVMNDLDRHLKRAVEIIVDGKKTTIKEAATAGIEEMNGVYYRKDSKRFIANLFKDARNNFLATSLDPVRYGRFLSGYKDGAVWNKLMGDLHHGDQERVRIMQQAYMAVQNVTDKYDRKQLVNMQRKAVEEFTMKDRKTGKDVKLSQDMLLAIYLTDMQADGHRHLCAEKPTQYTRVPDLDTMNGNRALPDFRRKAQKARAEYSHEIVLDKETLRKIGEYIEGDKMLSELARAINGVLNGFLADEINKVSMERYGKLIATVKNYFPMRVDHDDPNKKFETSFEGEGIFTDQRMKSRGFTKQRTFSYNALMIDGALTVFQRHVNETAEYCGLLIPVENIKKVINSDNGEITMRKEIEQKFGGSAVKYLNKLIGDIQERKDTTDDNLLTTTAGHMMGAALAFNPRSWLKNYGALPLANKYFGAANVSKAVAATKGGWGKTGKDLVAKYNDYTPYMWYREQGNGTVVGELSRQHGIYGRATDAVDFMSKFDRAVVNLLLYAAEQNVKQTTNLKADSEEFKQEVAKRFEKCVDASQPNSMLTSKPQFVRSKVMRVLTLNAFASQRMAMGNGLMDSWMEYRARHYEYVMDKNNAEAKAAVKKSLKGFFASFFGVLESAALQSLLGALASVLIFHKWDELKDEKGDITWESGLLGFLKKFGKGVPEEFFGSFAWADKAYSEIVSFIDKDSFGADMNVMNISAILDVVDKVKNGKWDKAFGKFMDFINLPLFGGTNMQKLIKSGWSYVQDIKNGKFGYTDNSGKPDYSYIDAQILNAYIEGDSDKADKLTDKWINQRMNEGRTEEKAVEYVEEKLAEGLVEMDDVALAAEAKFDGRLTEHKQIKEKYVEFGVPESVFDKAVTKLINKMDNGEDSGEEEEEPTVKSDYTYKDAVHALVNATESDFETARQELIDTMIANGKAESEEEAAEEVDKKLRSFSYTKDLFADYHSVSGEKFYKAKAALEKLYGDGLKAKYEDYVKKYVNAQ